MPNGKTHRLIGGVTGGVAALYYAREEASRAKLVETGAGVLGGMVGAMLPDLLDPPVSPRHRGGYHSLAVLVLLLTLVLESQRRTCRERAKASMDAGPRGPEPTLQSDAWLVASGFMTGLQWGYASHLGADMTTRAGLPLIRRGF